MLPIRTDELGKRCQKPLYPHPAHIYELARHEPYISPENGKFLNNTTKGSKETPFIAESPHQQHVLHRTFARFGDHTGRQHNRTVCI
jgi:hypothetical protein